MTPPLRLALRVASLATAGALLVAAAPDLMRDAPPAGHTGGFGEPTCHACHFQAPVGSGGGSLAIEGLPVAWEPGESYEISLLLRHQDLAVGGFQLTARFEEGTQAGTLQPGDSARVRLTTFRDVQYAHHTWDGAAPDTPARSDPTEGSGELRWVVRWTAPAEGTGTVVWHAAANAADDDDSPLGDFVYTYSTTLPAAPAPSR